MSDKLAALARPGVPAELMSAWQRWEMSSISAAPRSAGSAAAAPRALPPATAHPAPLIDEAELVRLRLQAQQAGQAEGHREGYAQGQAEGYAAGLSQAQEQAQALHDLLQSLPTAMRAAEREVADDLLALARDIARQMVRQELTTEPRHILALVRELLRMEPTLGGTPRLLMHVDDAALVQQHLADELHAAGWRIRTDLSIQRGGCRVHAAGGALDATLETRWERVNAAFAGAAPAALEVPHE
ncbi:MAG: flagellar assembly protein FliH [Rhodoferax sp.]|uniref:flagellar assembly protein FliH n=1 Tax=Rhodoferax sp. TaxID=50421 RepID=UPI00260FA539|nr:flagellar assembly protein FliH [Rhodoferax sp.]MDD5335609.1 flagellar assembly protein FliH [Rhodoferax sp.]